MQLALLLSLYLPTAGLPAPGATGVALPAPAAAGAPADTAVRVIERTAYLMGTLLGVRLAADGSRADAAAGAVFEEVARLEAMLSTWSPSAELALANAAPAGTAHRVTPELFGLLAEAGVWVARTGRAFDPAVGALVDAWDLRGTGRRPTAAELSAARAAAGWADTVLDAASLAVVRPHPAWWLDSGGFGKGAALRSAAAVLRVRGVRSYTLDFGGQLVQRNAAGESARIAVAHPVHRDRSVAVLAVRNGSVATSGASERYVEHEGQRLGHIVDPRSGLPVPPWGSVTVVAPDPFAADVLSTALFVMGADDALDWAVRNPEYGVLILKGRDDDQVCARWNATMDQWLVEPPAQGRGACGHDEDR